jgi:NADH-quinone oxidoreductase subunit N
VWLVVLAAINSVVGAYYYLRVIVAMYFWEPDNDYVPTAVAPALTIALTVCAIGTLYLGILPARVLSFAKAAADSLSVR